MGFSSVGPGCDRIPELVDLFRDAFQLLPILVGQGANRRSLSDDPLVWSTIRRQYRARAHGRRGLLRATTSGYGQGQGHPQPEFEFV
jgi:hypothetical protein